MKASVLLILVTIGLAACTESPKGDAGRGEKVHAACLDCHGTGVYSRADRKVKSLEALRQETLRWADYYAPPFPQQDIDDLVAYLNRDFYGFK